MKNEENNTIGEEKKPGLDLDKESGDNSMGKADDCQDEKTDDSPDALVQRYVDDEEGNNERLGCMSFYRAFVTGDVFTKPFFLRQVLFIIFVALLMLLYTFNRFDSQQDIIAIDSLKNELQEERYFVLTQSSELLNLTRQSNIEKRLRNIGDSALVNPSMPPFEIIVDDKDGNE